MSNHKLTPYLPGCCMTSFCGPTGLLSKPASRPLAVTRRDVSFEWFSRSCSLNKVLNRRVWKDSDLAIGYLIRLSRSGRPPPLQLALEQMSPRAIDRGL
jgi:hypothetical protein